jgi:hypothetical protein
MGAWQSVPPVATERNPVPRPHPASEPAPPADDLLQAALVTDAPTDASPLRPVERNPRRRRNQVCILILSLGLLNYLAYTLSYAALGGDALNGHREVQRQADGTTTTAYYVRGHFIHSLSGAERLVSRGAWLYSFIHSITLPLTSGAMIISMLVLARPHIIATMRGSWISGETFMIGFGTIVLCITTGATLLFLWNLISELSHQ